MSALGHARGLAGLALLGYLLDGCVPVPFRPSATVNHEVVTTQEQAPSVHAGNSRSEARSVAKAIQHDEPRVVLIDPAGFTRRLGATDLTLQEVVTAAQEGNGTEGADYLLSVAAPETRELHETGMAAPRQFSVVGYGKVQSEAVLSATLLDLRDPQALEVLCASSNYSESMVGLGYGVVTIALPEPGLREALAREVAHTLASARPEGAIRLLVLSQQTAPTDPESPQAGTAPPFPNGCDAKRPPNTVTAAALH